MKKSPLAIVNEQFGSKSALAEKLIPRLRKPEGESDEDFALRIRTMSNKHLLRLWQAEERVDGEFGGREKFIASLVTKKFPKGNAEYQAKLETYANTRLLDLA